jgi:hypothetical protein
MRQYSLLIVLLSFVIEASIGLWSDGALAMATPEGIYQVSGGYDAMPAASTGPYLPLVDAKNAY